MAENKKPDAKAPPRTRVGTSMGIGPVDPKLLRAQSALKPPVLPMAPPPPPAAKQAAVPAAVGVPHPMANAISDNVPTASETIHGMQTPFYVPNEPDKKASASTRQPNAKQPVLTPPPPQQHQPPPPPPAATGYVDRFARDYVKIQSAPEEPSAVPRVLGIVALVLVLLVALFYAFVRFAHIRLPW